MRRKQDVSQPEPVQPERRLRKQPKIRRLQTASAIPFPQMTVPRTASVRKRRNRWYVPTATIRQFVFSSRWVSLILLLIVVYALILTGKDLHFYLTMIPIEGATTIPPAEIVTASGLAGAHIFAADPNLAAKQIAAVPGVISATVTLHWPNLAEVKIKEDSPIAIWQEGEATYWITRNGRLLPARGDTANLLHIEAEVNVVGDGLTAPNDPASNVDSDPTAHVGFIPMAILEGALQLRELRPNIEQLYYRPSGGLSYQDGRGWRAYFGTGTDMAQKLVVYETIVADLQTRQLTPDYISVSNQNKPYYRAR